MIAHSLTADARATPCEDALRCLAEGGTYWLATAREDGRPHVMPVLAVVVDGALHFSTGAGTRKAKNLAQTPHRVVALSAPGLDLVVEGMASKVTDERRLARVAGAYDASTSGESPSATECSTTPTALPLLARRPTTSTR